MFEQSVKKYLEDYKSEAAWSVEDGYLLLGASQLYEATKEEFYKTFVLAYMEQNVSPNGKIRDYCKDNLNLSVMQCGKSLMTSYIWTHEVKYKTAIETLIAQLSKQPRTPESFFIESDKFSIDDIIKDLYIVEPFYMAYETFLGKKENYNDIINQFKNARNLLYSRDMAVLNIYNYAIALIDTINVTSEQIFEHYKQLEFQLKEAVKAMLPYENELNIIAGYVILKACNQGCLLRDKYQHKAKKIIQKHIEKGLPNNKKDIGIYMMAQAQLLIAENYD